jgi:hypothetical protein
LSARAPIWPPSSIAKVTSSKPFGALTIVVSFSLRPTSALTTTMR